MAATYHAQILSLSNTKHNDDEVLIHCDDIRELKAFIKNPADHIETALSGKWQGEKWVMQTPITMILGEQYSGLSLTSQGHVRNQNALSPFGNNLLLIDGLGDELEPNHWMALFAIKTGVVRVLYGKPDGSIKGVSGRTYKLTPPNLFYQVNKIGGMRGTTHFDLDVTNPADVNEQRAIFVLNYILDQSNVVTELNQLNTSAKKIGPGTLQGGKIGHQMGDTPKKVLYKNKSADGFSRIIIVDGLSDPRTLNQQNIAGEPLVCTQSGCVWMGDHWELDHMIVKNYVAP